MNSLELEYSALREEIITRIELRQKLLEINLVLAGVFLGAALNSGNYDLALAFPPLCIFLAVAWIQNDSLIRDAATYIRTYIEAKYIATPGWERSRHEKRLRNKWSYRLITLSHGGIFFITQFVTFLIGSLGKDGKVPSSVEALVIIDYASIFLVISLFVGYCLRLSLSKRKRE